MAPRLALRIGVLFGVIAGGCGGSGSEPTPSPSPLPSPAPTRVARLWLLAAAEAPDAAAPPPAVLLLSDDLGATWQSLADSGLAESTIAIDFRDAEHGVAVGGTMAQRTNDGGRTWLTQIDDPRETGWFCGADGGGPLVLHTADAGATFVRQPLPTDATDGLSSISFLNDRIGAAAGSTGGGDGRSVPLVLVTTDGGGTWTRASSPPGTSSTMALDIVP